MKSDITDAEMEVLKVLWRGGAGTVREIAARLPSERRRAYTTLQTLLKRLEDKGAVSCAKDKAPHVYCAVVTRQSLMKNRLNSIAEELCDGAAGPLVMALVEKNRFSKTELDSFRTLIDQLDETEE
jgi:BlaI family transcriptional regulator, penicillinase repressor